MTEDWTDKNPLVNIITFFLIAAAQRQSIIVIPTFFFFFIIQSLLSTAVIIASPPPCFLAKNKYWDSYYLNIKYYRLSCMPLTSYISREKIFNFRSPRIHFASRSRSGSKENASQFVVY